MADEPCRWSDGNGECMLDGLFCEGECENYEPKLVQDRVPQREMREVMIRGVR